MATYLVKNSGVELDKTGYLEIARVIQNKNLMIFAFASVIIGIPIIVACIIAGVIGGTLGQENINNVKQNLTITQNQTSTSSKFLLTLTPSPTITTKTASKSL